MSKLNQTILDTLTDYSGSVNDRKKSFFENQTSDTGALPDLEKKYYLSQPGNSDEGSLHDIKRRYFISLGYSGDLDEMERQFWINNALGGSSYGIVMLGQSEYHRLILSAHADLGNAGTVSDESALTIYWYDLDGTGFFDGVQTDQVTNSNKVSRWAVELSNALATLAPGAQFHVCCLLNAGTGLREMLDDTASSPFDDRLFSNDVLTYDAFETAFGSPDLAMMSWQNSDSTSLQNWVGDAWWTALTGTQINDGSAVATGTTVYGTKFDHFFSEMWDSSTVPFSFLMHRYDVLNGSSVADYARFRDVRVAMDRVVDNTRNTNRSVPFVRGIDPVAYQNPVSDQSHPEKIDDGATILAKMWAYNIVHGLGLSGTVKPDIDSVTWSTTTLTLGSSAGSITTTRSERSESVPVGQPKVAQLFFRAAEDPETLEAIPDAAIALTGGNIVITASSLLSGIGSSRSPAEFLAGDRIEFGPGGAGNNDTQDFTDTTWKDYPGIVDASNLMDIIPLQPINSAIVSDLTLSSPPTNLWSGDISSLGGTDQGGGWWYFGAATEVGDTNDGNLDLSSNPSTVTYVVDLDRIEGNTSANSNSASIRFRDALGTSLQTVTVNNLWGEVSLVSSNLPVGDNHGFIPLADGRCRVWMEASYTAGGRAFVYVNSSNNGGAYNKVGVFAGLLDVETIAGLTL